MFRMVTTRIGSSTKTAAKSPSAAEKRKGPVIKAKKKSGKKRFDICFVIMPFGGWLDDYYEAIYRPAIESAHLEAHRADDLYRPSTIVNDIWSYTKKAKLLLADLTGRNPNVFYELGLAHALGKPAILIAESMEEVPFDLRALRVIIYDKNAPEWGRILKEKIASSIREVLESPVAAVLPAFLELNNSAPKPVLTEHELKLVEMKQEIELLRHEMRSNLVRPIASRRSDPDNIGPEEARDRIMRYLGMGMPNQMLLKRMESLGVPDSWTLQTISELRPIYGRRTTIRKLVKPTSKK